MSEDVEPGAHESTPVVEWSGPASADRLSDSDVASRKAAGG
jgi:hypothetical protein